MNHLILSLLISLSYTDALELGTEAINNGKWSEAVYYFTIVSTSDLGTPAKASAFWGLYLAHDQLKNNDAAAEALFMFQESVLFFKDFLDEINGVQRGHPGVIWLIREKIADKLIYSQAMLDIYWMRKNTYYCRSETHKCVIPYAKVVGFYLQKLPFCGGNLYNVYYNEQGSDLYITAHCVDVDNNKDYTEKYYFKIMK